jgi:hypothetical protein
MPRSAQVRTYCDRRQFLQMALSESVSSPVGISIKPSVILPTLAN